MSTSPRVNASIFFVAACVTGVLAGAVFLGSAWSHFQAPDERDAAPASPAPLDYLRMRPFDPLGYLVLSESVGSDPPDTVLRLRAQALRAATLLAPVEPQVVRAEATFAFAQGDVRAGLESLARYATVSPGDRTAAFSALANYVTHPQWNDFAAAQLAAGWNDADPFLIALCTNPKTTQYSFSVAIHFARYRPISPDATHCVENRAIAAGDVQGAYRLRLSAAKSLPKRIGFVFNGDFELPLSGSAFDWILNAGGEFREGYLAAIRPETAITSHGKVLNVRFTRRAIQSPIARQYLVLPPARYQLSYLSKATPQIGANAPTWKLICVENGNNLIKEDWFDTEYGNDWKRHTVSFSVGPQCSGQLLLLDAKSKLTALEGLQGSVLIDDVRAERL